MARLEWLLQLIKIYGYIVQNIYPQVHADEGTLDIATTNTAKACLLDPIIL